MASSGSVGINETKSFDPTFISIVENIAINARHRPKDIAWIEGDLQLSWAEFNRDIDCLANALIADGLAAGDAVALIGGSSYWAYRVGFAVMRCGGVICPISALLTPEMLARLADNCGAKRLFVDADYSELGLAVREYLPSLRSVYAQSDLQGKYDNLLSFAELLKDAPTEEYFHPLRAEDPANVIYSSGTTGMPKGIVHSHGARVGFMHQLAHGLHFTRQSRTIVATPINSNATWMMIFPAIWLGGSVITFGAFNVDKYLDECERLRPTHSFIVPTQARFICESPRSATQDLSHLECVVTAGAPMPLQLKDAMRQRIGESLYELWGFSESVGTIIDPQEMRQRPESVGRLWTGSDLRIINEQGEDITGQGIGEIVGRTNSIMSGYHRRDEANEEIQWHDNYGRLYLRTGDIGELDEDGYLYLRGRKKDIILSGGLNVFPIDIENSLLEHEVVVDVAVFPVEDEKWGETPVAAVILAKGQHIAPGELKTWLNQRLAKFQRVSDVYIADQDFPRNTMGKVQKAELKERYLATLG